jgi:uncharacterized membrane protein YvlD (DUF360 family)
MTYLRSLFLNFLIVFFVNRVIPGIEVTFFEHIPNIGADLVFSAIVGLLNSLIFPFLVLFKAHPSSLKITIISFIISFGSFIVIGISDLGVRATSIGSIIVAGLIVWVMSFFTNYLEMRHAHKFEE